MANLEKEPGQEKIINQARGFYDEYRQENGESWSQNWLNELVREGNINEKEASEDLARFFANNGGNPHQIVFYLEKTDLKEKEKWQILSLGLLSCAEFDFQNIDKKKEELERAKKYNLKFDKPPLKRKIKNLELRKKLYQERAELLSQAADLN